MKLRLQAMSKPHLRHPDANGFPLLAGRTDIVPTAGATRERIAAAIVDTRAGYQKTEIVTDAGDRKSDGCPDCGALSEGREVGARLGVRLLGCDVATSSSLRIVGCTMWTGSRRAERVRAPSIRLGADSRRAPPTSSKSTHE